MRVHLIAVGRLRDDALRDLYRKYETRLPWPVSLREIEIKKRLPEKDLIKQESKRLTAALPERATIVLLDERGKNFTSLAFAGFLQNQMTGGESDLAFVIGGPAGIDDSLIRRADLRLSLGAMTWPHMLVRVMLMEQLYRAHSILTDHPYHRG